MQSGAIWQNLPSRLIDLSTSVEKLHHCMPLTQEAKLDMKWWLDFLPQWPGNSLIHESHWTSNTLMKLFTNASGKDGCELTGQDNGSLTIGPQHSRVKQASPGRSSMPLLWPLTHGVLGGTLKIPNITYVTGF